mgnify:CR=1 FL=1
MLITENILRNIVRKKLLSEAIAKDNEVTIKLLPKGDRGRIYPFKSFKNDDEFDVDSGNYPLSEEDLSDINGSVATVIQPTFKGQKDFVIVRTNRTGDIIGLGSANISTEVEKKTAPTREVAVDGPIVKGRGGYEYQRKADGGLYIVKNTAGNFTGKLDPKRHATAISNIIKAHPELEEVTMSTEEVPQTKRIDKQVASGKHAGRSQGGLLKDEVKYLTLNHTELLHLAHVVTHLGEYYGDGSTDSVLPIAQKADSLVQKAVKDPSIKRNTVYRLAKRGTANFSKSNSPGNTSLDTTSGGITPETYTDIFTDDRYALRFDASAVRTGQYRYLTKNHKRQNQLLKTIYLQLSLGYEDPVNWSNLDKIYGELIQINITKAEKTLAAIPKRRKKAISAQQQLISALKNVKSFIVQRVKMYVEINQGRMGTIKKLDKEFQDDARLFFKRHGFSRKVV